MIRESVLIFVALAAIFALAGAEEAKKSLSDLNRQIKRAIDAGKEDEALGRIRELGAIRSPEALGALFDLGTKVQLPKMLYRAVTEILAQRSDEESLKFFEGEVKSTSEVRRIYLADVMAEMKHERAAAILGQLADDRSTPVLRSTIVALSKQRSKGSVEPLLKILERLDTARDRGQVYQEVRDALFEVTGQDFDALQDWKKWWDVQAATFDPGKQREGPTRTRKPSRDAAPEFAGKKIFGKNVVFVIDTSGTMQYVMKDDIPGLASADGSDRAGRVQDPDEQISRPNERLAKFWTRMEMAKRELLKALQAFDPRARINVLEFNTRVKKMEKTLIPASAQMKKAMDWVKRMKWIPDGNTNTMDALEQAFAVDRSITEIYFLSDGIPSKDGKRNDPTDPILDKVEVLNRFRKVKIHTFGYDPVSIREGVENQTLVQANGFLKKLATSTGGTFHLLKVTDEQPPKGYKAKVTAGASGGGRFSAR